MRRGGGLEFYNLALGDCNAIQNLYELKRHKNTQFFANAKLIITESNINEQQHHAHPKQKLSYDLIFKTLKIHYTELSTLNKAVLVLILPYPYANDKMITNIHKKFCLKFGFNFIDMHEYYEKNKLIEFGKRIDPHHQQVRIMKELGLSIISHINEYKKPKFKEKSGVEFKICTPKDMILKQGKIKEIKMQNSAFDEQVFRIDRQTLLQFPQDCVGFRPVGLHTWNNNYELEPDIKAPKNFAQGTILISSVVFEKKDIKFSKEVNYLNTFVEVQRDDFIIDGSSSLRINKADVGFSEYHIDTHTWLSHQLLQRADIIAIFLAKFDENYEFEKVDFNELEKQDITIPPEYNFYHIIPPILTYKEIIDEYCAIMDRRKMQPLNDEIANLKNEILALGNSVVSNEESAIYRVKNYLSYKLGNAMIACSGSAFGYISLIFILIFIAKEHRKNTKKYAKPIEECVDYEEAKRLKNHLSFKLGDALLKAYKNMWRGALIKFMLYDAWKIKRDFKKGKKA